jgi:single-strand DNA-binding protein
MSTDLNKVILIGNLTRDAELKYTANGKAVSQFAIAVHRRKRNGEKWDEETSFFDIMVFGKLAESIHPCLRRSKMVAIDGELRQIRWMQDGYTRSKIEIIANHIQLLSIGDRANNDWANGELKPDSLPELRRLSNDVPF